MQRRIYFNYLKLILLCALLLAAATSLIFYDTAKRQEITAAQDRAALLAGLLNKGLGYDSLPGDVDSARMTVIAPDGAVLLDDTVDAHALDNHSDRTEFLRALADGIGEATRYSSTLRGETYYYAVRLADGNVLRLSETIRSISGVFTAMLPAIFAVIAVVLCLAHLIARRLTANIVRPLNDISFEGDNVPTDVYDELLPFVRRIDRQKREIDGQLVALKSRADTIEAITGNMQEGLILIDRSGVVLIFNKSAADIFGGDDMAHRNVRHICREITFQQGLGRCLAGEHAQINFARAGKIYDVFFSPVYGGGAINGAVILFLDITEKHNAEEQRRAFSANVSHELKTPLTTISALSEMMETGMARAEDVRDFAAKIAGQAKRLIDIIDDIIRLSEFDEGKISKEYTVFDLYELAESVMDALQERADAKHVALRVAGAHLQVRANKRMIDELLYNLVDNGIKYNRVKGRVTVTLSEEDDLCKIAVDDTGIGIPAAHQGRVFERFYRVDTSRSKKTGGTGLGLSIVKHIVEHHGGKIEMQSTEGVGTTVVCYIAKQN